MRRRIHSDRSTNVHNSKMLLVSRLRNPTYLLGHDERRLRGLAERAGDGARAAAVVLIAVLVRDHWHEAVRRKVNLTRRHIAVTAAAAAGVGSGSLSSKELGDVLLALVVCVVRYLAGDLVENGAKHGGAEARKVLAGHHGRVDGVADAGAGNQQHGRAEELGNGAV